MGEAPLYTPSISSCKEATGPAFREGSEASTVLDTRHLHTHRRLHAFLNSKCISSSKEATGPAFREGSEAPRVPAVLLPAAPFACEG